MLQFDPDYSQDPIICVIADMHVVIPSIDKTVDS